MEPDCDLAYNPMNSFIGSATPIWSMRRRMISRTFCSVVARFHRSLIPAFTEGEADWPGCGVEKARSLPPIAVTEVASFFRAASAAALSFSFSERDGHRPAIAL